MHILKSRQKITGRAQKDIFPVADRKTPFIFGNYNGIKMLEVTGLFSELLVSH